MNVDQMGGRALDVAVAQYVFGWEVEERTSTRTPEKDWVCREPGKEWVGVSFYRLGEASSITIEAKLADLGWHRRQSPFLRWPDPHGTVQITLEKGDERVDATGKTFAEALCRVALKVVQEGWTAAERLSYARSTAAADARPRAAELVALFKDCDSEPTAEWRLRGFETAQEWLRLIESPFVSQEEVSSLMAIAKANLRSNRLWALLGKYVWLWASQMGYTVPTPRDYLHQRRPAVP